MLLPDPMSVATKQNVKQEMDAEELPPAEVLLRLVDRIEEQLPKDDTVKFDSR